MSRPATSTSPRSAPGMGCPPPAALLCLCLLGPATRSPAAESPVCRHGGPACRVLNQWFDEGTAAGNLGDQYDNRDRGHSQLRTADFPQLGVVTYDDEQRSQQLDWAAQRRILPRVTIGNSSTAAGVTAGGSNVRGAYYVSEQGIRFLYAQYRANNLYVYPAHHDHGPGHNGCPGYGDLFPTNSPCVVISQGSSGSDRPFVEAIVHTLAAFRPEVKRKLIEAGLLMPTLQSIFRASNRQVVQAEDYLTGQAHPTVFSPAQLDPLRMVEAAHDLRLDSIPPLVQLSVREEGAGGSRPDAYADASERLADTPAAIARIIRGPACWRRLVVSAAASYDLNGRPLSYRWVVLRGDVERIRIEPRGDGAVAELVVPHHPRRPIAAGSPIDSNRVDIGVFVHNGETWSAPGFITFWGLDNELRTYDDAGRPLEIWHRAADCCLQIADWPGLLRAIAVGADRLPGSLLATRFDPAQRAALESALARLEPAQSELAQRSALHEQAKAVHQRAKDDVEPLRGPAAAPEATRSPGEPKEGRSAAQTDRALERAVAAERQAWSNLAQARKAVDEAKARVEAILAAGTPAFAGQPLDRAVEAVLEGLTRDPRFYVDHAAEIDALVEAAPEGPDRAEFVRSRDRLLRQGLLVAAAGGGFRIQPTAWPPGAPSVDLTGFERQSLAQHHLVILTRVLWPGLLSGRATLNYVDPRLAKAEPVRDLYFYDPQGQLVERRRLPVE